MPDALQRAALLVYRDLVSRWAAMGAGPCNLGVGSHPRADLEANHCFVAGSAAAARLDNDLAALQFINLSNLGCANVGGSLATDPIPVVWQSKAAEGGQPAWQGTVAGTDFRGTYDRARGRAIYINAR
jgi:hypothetical protein